MLLSIAISVTLFVAAAHLHLVSLRFCSGRMSSFPMRPHTRVLSILSLLFVTHLLQIGLFAGGFWIAETVFQIGGFEGAAMVHPLDYLYYSAVIYTSLGIGEIVPTGHLRFLTGVEALNGLLLIAWSASFLFATMNRLWDWEPCVEPDDLCGWLLHCKCFLVMFAVIFVSTVVCPACLCFGIASTGPDEFRERGSNRLIDLRRPLPFPECPCSWLT